MSLPLLFSRARFLLALLLVALLSACGGGTNLPPVVTALRVGSVMYGKTATIYIGGADLRSSIVADTGGLCANPSYASNSTTEVLVLNCKVNTVGAMPITLTAADGSVLYRGSVTVPKPQVLVASSEGTFTLELDPAAAPVTVRNFLAYVNASYYSTTLFHRVIPGFVVQGGGYTTGMVAKPGKLDPIVLETPNGLSNVRGTVSMARTSLPNSATSEFFINLVDNSSTLDYRSAASPGYAVFGTVLQGIDVIDTIATKPTGSVNGFNDVPQSDITMNMVLQIR